MSNSLWNNFCSICLFLVHSTKTMADVMLSEPDYQHILYGGVWKHVTLESSSISSDIAQARQNLLPFLQARHQYPNDFGDDVFVTCLTKLDLWLTRSDHMPLTTTQHVESRDQSHHPVSVPLSVGSTYNFQLLFKKNDSSLVHYITITKLKQTGTFHIYSHTFHTLSDLSDNTNQCNYFCPKEGFSRNLQVLSNLSREKTLEILLPDCGKTDWRTPSTECLSHKDNPHTYTCDGIEKEGKHSDHHVVGNKDLKVMSYNIWHFFTYQDNGEYHQRLDRISQVLKNGDPDIIAFQEIRLETPCGGHLGPSQMDHLMSLLPDYQFVYQPAMMQTNTLEQGRTEEGVAIFSKFPIVHHDYLLLFRNQSNTADQHQRVCLHAVISVPSLGNVHIFNTHFSLSHEAREVAVKQMQEYMKHFGDNLIIFLGDLNATPEEKAIRTFTAESEMIDIWDFLYPASPGYTYSSLEEKLSKRIDYIFVNRLPKVKVQKMEVMPDKTKAQAASDHRAIMATFMY